jgi:hypothetical protein
MPPDPRLPGALQIIRIIRQSLGAAVPIKILTSARPLISFRNGESDVESIAEAILRAGLVQDNVEITHVR